MSSIKLAVVCLLPDLGHAIPLLRIAQLVRRAGGELKYFGPEETLSVARSLEIPCVDLGPVRPAHHQAMIARLARSGEVYRRVRLEKWFYENYFQPLIEAGFRRVDTLQQAVLAFQPHLVLSDDHLFRGAYKTVAETSGVPLITHCAYGSNYSPDEPTAAVRLMSKVAGAGSAHLERLFAPQKFAASEARRKYIDERWAASGAVEQRARNATHRISCGLAPLEKKYLPSLTFRQDIAQFGPLPPLAAQQDDEQLRAWLDDGSGRGTVYVSFGTMTPANSAAAIAIVDEIVRQELRVLWAAPHCPWGAELRFPKQSVRWEKWVAQPNVLANPNVLAFVTHAGSGAMQEALWYGKPVVCIPMMWDQPHNATVAEQMGVGVRVDKHRLTSAALRDALSRVRAPAIVDRTRQLSEELRNLRSEAQVLDLIESAREM